MTVMDNSIQNMPSEELIVDNVFCNNVMYLPLKDAEVKDGDSIEKIIDRVNDKAMSKLPPEEQAAIKEQIKYIEGMIAQNPELKEMTISDLSWEDKNYDRKEDHPYDGMQAAVFHKGDDKYITYRGTPDGSWIDNSEIVSSLLMLGDIYVDNNGEKVFPLSPMQREGLEYMDSLREKYEEEWKDSNIHVSGHSKGDILAALAMVLNSDFIDDCVGINGPGISESLYSRLEKLIGVDTITEIQKDMYKYNEINDYVNTFGKHIYKEDNIYWYKGYHDPKDIYQAHLIANIYNINIGKLAPLQKEQGYLGKFLRKMYDKLDDKSPSEKAAACTAIMIIMQHAIVKEKAVGKDLEYYLRESTQSLKAVYTIKEVFIEVLKEEEGLNMIAYLIDIGVINDLIGFDNEYIDLGELEGKELTVDEVRTLLIREIEELYTEKNGLVILATLAGFLGNYMYKTSLYKRNRGSLFGAEYNYNAKKLEILNSKGITSVNYTNISNLIIKLDEYIAQMDTKYIADAEAIKTELKYIINKVNHDELNKLIYNYSIQKKGLETYKVFINEYKLRCEEVEKKFIEALEIKEEKTENIPLNTPYYFEH